VIQRAPFIHRTRQLCEFTVGIPCFDSDLPAKLDCYPHSSRAPQSSEVRGMACWKHRVTWQAQLLLGALAFLSSLPLVRGDESSAVGDAKLTARCEQAEALLRDGKTKEARELLAPLIASDELARSKQRARVLVDHGFASFLLKHYVTAGRSLGQLAPFDDPHFGSYARYLLGRVHHLEDERAEAMALYESVMAEHEAGRKRAADSLQHSDQLKPDEKTRLEGIVSGPQPEHVARAGFYLALLHYEGGRFIEAQARFVDFVGRNPESAFARDARFYLGCCAFQLRQFAEAIEILMAVAEKDTTLTGPALLWLGKAYVASAEGDDEEASAPSMKRAIDTLRRAVEKTAKDRRGDALLELADALLLTNQAEEAAKLYGRIRNERLLPRRAEEVLQRLVTAWSMNGDASETERFGTEFEKKYPQSVLMPEVLFRRADAAMRGKGAQEPIRSAAPLFQRITDKYPESSLANPARMGLAWTHYYRRELDKAREALETIPQAERTGDLATVPYLLADCLIRLAPTKADDALAAGKLQEQIGAAATLLTDFVTEQPDSDLASEALMRLALCQERLAAVMSNPEERNKLLAAARASYERALVEYPLRPRGPVAVLARARLLSLAGDPNEAIRRLQAFSGGSLKRDPAAPLAMLLLSELVGAQENKAADAARILTLCRKRHEASIRSDPKRADWAPLIQYRHALALMDGGQPDEARAVLDDLRKTYPTRPEAAEAALCWGQALRDGGAQLIERANQTLGNPNALPADRKQAEQDVARGQEMIGEALSFFERQADQYKGKGQAGEIRARLLYQAIWMLRTVANDEFNAARTKIQDERRQQRQQELEKVTPEGQQKPNVLPPPVPPEQVPLQPAETKSRALYQKLIVEFPDLPLSFIARLELGELIAERKEHETAIKVFVEALDKEPPQELSDRLRMRLAASHMARGDWKAALAQLETLSRTPENPFAAPAQYRAGECLVRLGDRDAGIKRLVAFRDVEALQNLGGVSDPALARLGQLCARMEQWEASRQAYAQLLSRFPDSPWASEARLGLGWAWQQQKEYAKALEVYAQIPLDPPTEPAARVRILIGVCHLERKQPADAQTALLAVPMNYDFPDLCAFALIEAAHAAVLADDPEQSEKLLRRVVQAYPKSKWAAVAEERLKKSVDSPAHRSPAAAALLMPENEALPPLEFLGQQQEVRATLGETVDRLVEGLILAKRPQPSLKPAPFVRIVLPDPFEHRGLIPLRIEQAAERLP
jgi:TolA-binding protein